MTEAAIPVLQAAKGKPVLGTAALRAVACTGGQARAVWNHFLALNIARYKEDGTFVFYHAMSAMLPSLLRDDERLRGLSHVAAQRTVRKLDKAIRDSFPSAGPLRKGFPKFRRRGDRDDAFSFAAVNCIVLPYKVRLPRIGWVKVRGLDYPPGSVPKVVSLTLEPDGWKLSVQFEAPPREYTVPTKPPVGIDVGVRTMAAMSDGSIVESPRERRKVHKRVRRLNRSIARQQKGSVNRKRTVAKLGRVHRRSRDRRRNHIHHETKRLVATYEGFAVESLGIKGVMRSLGDSLGDIALGTFVRTLKYKAAWAGRSWYEHPRFFRSTGVCPDCGLVGPRLGRSVTRWTCDRCGMEHDRDVAAARVMEACAAGGVCAHTVAEEAASRADQIDRKVGPARPEPVPARGRKRGSAVRGGGTANAGPSSGGPPTNDRAAGISSRAG